MKTAEKKMKISAWLEKQVRSHDVYAEPAMSELFEKMTGKKACWRKHQIAAANQSVGDFKGMVSRIEGDQKKMCSYGWEIAEDCETVFAKTDEHAQFMGRGFSFNAAVDALKKKKL